MLNQLRISICIVAFGLLTLCLTIFTPTGMMHFVVFEQVLELRLFWSHHGPYDVFPFFLSLHNLHISLVTNSPTNNSTVLLNF